MKVKIGSFPFLYPIPIVLMGTVTDHQVNFTTIGDCAIMGVNPALIVVSLLESHFSTKGVIENKCFSINLPMEKHLQMVDYCGIVSGKETNKSELFEYDLSENNTHIPLIRECPVNMECEVIKHTIFEKRNIFIAKVTQTWLDDQYLSQTGQKPSMPPLSELRPIIYSMDNHYYSIGKIIGTGYKEGIKLNKKYLEE